MYFIYRPDRRQAGSRQDPLSGSERRVDHRDRDRAGRSGTGRVNNGESIRKPLERLVLKTLNNLAWSELRGESIYRVDW